MRSRGAGGVPALGHADAAAGLAGVKAEGAGQQSGGLGGAQCNARGGSGEWLAGSLVLPESRGLCPPSLVASAGQDDISDLSGSYCEGPGGRRYSPLGLSGDDSRGQVPCLARRSSLEQLALGHQGANKASTARPRACPFCWPGGGILRHLGADRQGGWGRKEPKSSGRNNMENFAFLQSFPLKTKGRDSCQTGVPGRQAIARAGTRGRPSAPQALTGGRLGLRSVYVQGPTLDCVGRGSGGTRHRPLPSPGPVRGLRLGQHRASWEPEVEGRQVPSPGLQSVPLSKKGAWGRRKALEQGPRGRTALLEDRSWGAGRTQGWGLVGLAGWKASPLSGPSLS